ncbi:MAG TPA: CPBP family glutamic-type intramembrane protease [Candidatus Latescibacteria bacterium]|nr:CPBP family glutamic-type intramembrane protease [Candidatus Latescibacterota bacterium]HRR34527.1 CPBP family glutamic-type intramembrane protease [Kiritimatiellia bacterium]
MSRLWCECVLLYVGLPLLLAVVRLTAGAFPVLPVLWVAAVPAAVYLVKHEGWGRREFFGFETSCTQVLKLGFHLLAVAVVLSGTLMLVAPARFLELPRRSLRLWSLVMVFYPLLSVFPQGILYRGLFFARYASLFPDERMCRMAGAAAFSLAHLVFLNPWALLLTLMGGMLFNRTYRTTGSLNFSNVEHAVCGQLVFTCGWGRYLYHGITRLAEYAR